MSIHRSDEQVVRDAQTAIAATGIQRALDAGSVTFSDYPPGQAEQILAGLPDAAEMDVPTSVRLPAALHRQLRQYAEEHQTTASALIRQWVEQMLTVPERTISLADAVRVLSTLPGQDQHAA